jgi:hypothetical protein
MVLTEIQELASGFEGSATERTRGSRAAAEPPRIVTNARWNTSGERKRASARTQQWMHAPLLFVRRCEKKVEIDFLVTDAQHDLRTIPRAAIDAFLTLAKCTVISTRNNKHFDSYLLSESSLFIFPTKIIIKTCGTTMLLKSVQPILVRPQHSKLRVRHTRWPRRACTHSRICICRACSSAFPGGCEVGRCRPRLPAVLAFELHVPAEAALPAPSVLGGDRVPQ